MNSHEAIEYNVQGKRLFFHFKCAATNRIYAEFWVFFFPIHMILFSSNIPFENSYIYKGILENLA